MHTWPFTAPCGFHERQVVENKDRFLEGAEFTDEWESYMLDQGIEKQKRELYRKRADYKQSLGAFSWEQDSSSHSDTFTGNRACLLYTSPSPRDATLSRMPSSA